MHIGRKAPPPPPKPRPVISEPIPGSGRKIEGQGSAGRPVPPNPAPAARPGIPKNEYPQNHSVPNNVIMQRPDGKLEKHTLPPGAKLSSPMGGGHASHTSDSHMPGWPASNHYTNKYNDLRKGYREAETRHETAPKESKKEAKTAMLQAKREMEVFRQRFSRPMSTEADHRETVGRQARAEARAWRPAAEEPSVAPQARRTQETSFPKASRQPGLETIAEHEPTLTLPPGARLATNSRLAETRPAGQPALPHSDQVFKLQSQYGEAKKNYYGIKGEPGNHTRQEIHNARAEYLGAKDNLDNYRKMNKAALKDEAAQRESFNKSLNKPLPPTPQAPQSHSELRISMGLPGLPQPPQQPPPIPWNTHPVLGASHDSGRTNLMEQYQPPGRPRNTAAANLDRQSAAGGSSRPSQSGQDPQPTHISAREGQDIIARVRRGESIQIPPGGLAFNGPDGKELIL